MQEQWSVTKVDIHFVSPQLVLCPDTIAPMFNYLTKLERVTRDAGLGLATMAPTPNTLNTANNPNVSAEHGLNTSTLSRHSVDRSQDSKTQIPPNPNNPNNDTSPSSVTLESVDTFVSTASTLPSKTDFQVFFFFAFS